jgi:hypothetical protein
VPTIRSRPLRALLAAGLVLAAVGAWTGGATAAPVQEFLATLAPAQANEFVAWRAAKARYDQQLDAYWAEIEKKRAGRRAKRGSTKFFDTNDYVWSFPPTYQGPRLSPELDRSWARFLAAQEQSTAQPAKEKRELPGLADFLAAARKHYGFEPTRITEREFKRRYAEQAISLGLTKEQVVRVYALETGGDGTADMQAGINPITKKGKPISSALGYAQLLHANTIGELVKHGDMFIKRLQRLQASTSDPARADELHRKIAALQAMMRSAKSVPDDWYRHVAFAQTSRGYGIHAINLDGDIGPWLQSQKLRGLKDSAGRKGVTNLSGEELEIMNLSGPSTGLEMMQPVGLTVPTPNFFARRAYYVNKMVIGKTSAELLAEFTRRMDASSRKAGAVEFAAAFDEARQDEKLPWR